MAVPAITTRARPSPDGGGPLTGAPAAAARRLAHLTSVHSALDGRIFRKEAGTLARAGYDVVVIAAHERSEVVDGVRIRAVPVPGGRRQRITATLPAVWRAAREEDADLYHFHDPELIPVGIRLKLAGKRVIYDVHEDVPRQILSKYWINPWLRRGVSYGAALAEWAGVRLFDGVVAATPAIARRFRPEKTVTVQNFPAFDELLTPDSRPYRERGPLFAYVGGITAVRGVREMVRALAALSEELPNVRLALAGTFTETGLEADCRRLPGWARVDALGWRSRPEVAALLGRARAGLVLFHPEPNHVEAQPNKLFEYMAAGVPVIASDFPLWRRIVDGVGCGLLVDPLAPAAIAEAMRWLLDHPEEAEAMGKRGRAAVAETYNWDAEAEKLLAFYGRLLPS